MKARQFTNTETAAAIHDIEIQELQTKIRLIDGRMWAILISIAGVAIENLLLRGHS